MNNLLYQGVGKYPSAPFVIDKIYSSYTEMNESADTDGIYPGRFVLVKYCDVSFDQETKKSIHLRNDVGDLTSADPRDVYRFNYVKDFGNRGSENYPSLGASFSHDGTVWIKSMSTFFNELTQADEQVYRYLPVANLNAFDYPTNMSQKQNIAVGEICSEDFNNKGQVIYGEIFNDYNNNRAAMGSRAGGSETEASGMYAQAEGFKTKAIGKYARAEGNNTSAKGESAWASGSNSSAYGDNSSAEGKSVVVYGNNSHARGNDIIVYGRDNHVFGDNHQIGKANMDYPPRQGWVEGSEHYVDIDSSLSLNNDDGAASHFIHVEGRKNVLINAHSAHVEGLSNTVKNSYRPHVEGESNLVEGASRIHVGGYRNTIKHPYSFVHGLGLETTAQAQVLFGKGNRTEDIDGEAEIKDIVFAIGAGTGYDYQSNTFTKRQNVFEILRDGSATLHSQGSYDNSIVIKETLDRRLQDVATLADYIVEQESNNQWTWRKWGSGLVECWCTVNIDQYNDSRSLMKYLTLPLQFNEITNVQITDRSQSSSEWDSFQQNPHNLSYEGFSRENNQIALIAVFNSGGVTDRKAVPVWVEVKGIWKQKED